MTTVFMNPVTLVLIVEAFASGERPPEWVPDEVLSLIGNGAHPVGDQFCPQWIYGPKPAWWRRWFLGERQTRQRAFYVMHESRDVTTLTQVPA